jgi:hypothetical protein
VTAVLAPESPGTLSPTTSHPPPRFLPHKAVSAVPVEYSWEKGRKTSILHALFRLFSPSRAQRYPQIESYHISSPHLSAQNSSSHDSHRTPMGKGPQCHKSSMVIFACFPHPAACLICVLLTLRYDFATPTCPTQQLSVFHRKPMGEGPQCTGSRGGLCRLSRERY